MLQVEIRVRGQIDQDWSGRLGGLTITHTLQGESVLAGPVRDQAELRSVLCRLADLGLEIISFNVTPDRVSL